MKNNLNPLFPSQAVLNRRMLGVLALGAALSACGGGGSDNSSNDGGNGGSNDGPATPVATAQVVASTWSDALPALPALPAGVGASGLIYFYATENFDEKYEPVLKQYRPDGSLVSSTRLPGSVKVNGAFPETIAVVEKSSADEIFVAVAFTAPSGMINTKITSGGYIARLNTKSGEVSKILESDTICPSGLARDGADNLYTMDLKTGNVLRLAAGQNEAAIIYHAQPGVRSTNIMWDIVFYAKGMVAVTADGTVYATLEGTHPASEDSYGGSFAKQIVRLRNGQADLIATNGVVRGLGAHGNDAFFLASNQTDTLVRKIDAAGTVSIVAGTPGSNAQTQWGSPDVLGVNTQWIDLTPDGRIHLHTQADESPRFYSVLLANQG